MNLALLLLMPVSASANIEPRPAPAAPVAAVTAYDAMVATEETPAAVDIAKPAVFIEDSAAKAIVGASGTRWTA
ncbi:MAG TPA: hypothetical protein VM145_05460 [Sphingomicrobium sp.]|nr:hypothetical protein [Sphingomicrobium sp.]